MAPRGKPYPEESRERMKEMLREGRFMNDISRETKVSGRTIRRWKQDLAESGRIGKPPGSRTGRHRALNADVEQALVDHVDQNQGSLSVDEMLIWLYNTYSLVVTSRTVRRIFERRDIPLPTLAHNGNYPPTAHQDAYVAHRDSISDAQEQDIAASRQGLPYQSPYAPSSGGVGGGNAPTIHAELAHALAHMPEAAPADDFHQAEQIDVAPAADNEDALQQQLNDILAGEREIQRRKRDIERKLEMRRNGGSSIGGLESSPTASPNATESTANPRKRKASQNKDKAEEVKQRTEKRAQRLLDAVEHRMRRRNYLTAEWVTSKSIWPVKARDVLAGLMHQHGLYAHYQGSTEDFERLLGDLYQLVDHQRWDPAVHDDLLRKRTRLEMSHIRTKLLKSGEVVSCGDGQGGWRRADQAMQHAPAPQYMLPPGPQYPDNMGYATASGPQPYNLMNNEHDRVA